MEDGKTMSLCKCKFAASDPSVDLTGGIYLASASDQDLLDPNKAKAFMHVVGTTSDQVVLESGQYVYEFNIGGGTTFDLVAIVNGAETSPINFDADPDDPLKKARAKIRRMFRFQVP
jgi:hypothetical protein